MRTICVLGGTGFVGTQLAARLARHDDLRIRVLTRDPARATQLAVLPSVERVLANVHDLATLRREFNGCSAVINLVGILNETGFSGRGFEQAHAELTRKVVTAARERGVPKLLQMSSLGADEQAPSHYLRSKGRAEQHVRDAAPSLSGSIFRPSVIFGAQDSLTNRFARLLRLTGGILPLARAGARFAPIFVDDVVTALESVLQRGAAGSTSYDLCGPDVFTLRELVEFVGLTAGSGARVLPLPDAIARVQAFVMDFVPGRPFSTDNYRSLGIDSLCRDNGCARLGIEPTSLRAVAASWLGPGERNARRQRARAERGG